jgi:hypothetical protein
MLRLIFLLVLVTNQTNSWAAETAKSLLTPQEQSQPLIKKDVWLKKSKVLLSSKMCKPKSLIRNCLLIDDKQCQEFSQTLSEACFKGLEKRLPDSLTSLDQKHYAKLVKVCTYDLFDKLLSDKKVPHPECRSLVQNILPASREHAETPAKPLTPILPTPPLSTAGQKK